MNSAIIAAKRKVIFWDRDGTIIKEPPIDKQVDSLEKFEFINGAIGTLSRIRKNTSYLFVLVTNQDGLGTDSFPEESFWPCQNLMLRTLAAEGVEFDDIYIDRSLPQDNAPTRKPLTGMLGKYLSGNFDLRESYVVGDRSTDVELAKNLGAQAIYFGNETHPDAKLSTANFEEIEDFLIRPPRCASVERKTSETSIRVSLCLDGKGQSKIKTGIGFFDHMLEQIARHASMDLQIEVAGDLHVDEHHTIEDCALALGEAISQALGDKRGIERYAFVLPMDDCLAQVALDFSGRSWLVWDADFKREKVGEMPTEMFFHFFKSFSDMARCNLNVKAEGQNEHHKIESIFKAFARCIRQAVKRDSNANVIPSTKGVL